MTLLATPASKPADVQIELRRLIRIAASVYGVRPSDLGPGRQGRYGAQMPAWLEARYAVLQIALDKRLGLFGDAVRALGFQNSGSITIRCAGMRAYRVLVAEGGDPAARRAMIVRRFDSRADVVSVPQDPADGKAFQKFGPKQVTGARLRRLRADGWTVKGLCRQFQIDEITVCSVLKEGAIA